MANDSKKRDFNKEAAEGAKGFLGDALKKVFTAGVGAAFMTEESVRAYLSELKLPKEVLTVVLQSAQKTKEDITGKVTQELLNVIQKIDFVKEFSKFAETHKFKISAEIEILKKDKASKDE